MPKGELLLEVRCEEIPARMLEPAVRELGTRVFEELMAVRLAPRVRRLDAGRRARHQRRRRTAR